jgi:hypothetical protein
MTQNSTKHERIEPCRHGTAQVPTLVREEAPVKLFVKKKTAKNLVGPKFEFLEVIYWKFLKMVFFFLPISF